MHPPVIKGGHRQDGQVIPLHGVGVLRRCFRRPLQESEEIDSGSALLETLEKVHRIVGKIVLLAVKSGDSDKAPLHSNLFAADLHFTTLLEDRNLGTLELESRPAFRDAIGIM